MRIKLLTFLSYKVDFVNIIQLLNFNNTERGAKCSALLYLIISTVHANHIDVEKYLTDLFSNPPDTILLPWNKAFDSCR